VRAAPDAGAGEDQHIVEVLDPLDPKQLGIFSSGQRGPDSMTPTV